MAKLKVTKGFVVCCMQCHQQIGETRPTREAAMHSADIHFRSGDKPHGGHEVVITKCEIVTLEK